MWRGVTLGGGRRKIAPSDALFNGVNNARTHIQTYIKLSIAANVAEQ